MTLAFSPSEKMRRYHLTSPENQRKLPVIVGLFGTNFISETSRDDFYGPDRFMQTQDIILVTVNYRLGPFGFLSLGTEDCPGNQALWDQVLALKWVKENIAAFGGDENNVTLLGKSLQIYVCVSLLKVLHFFLM